MGVLDDKVAIVTGSARGIGKATAELLSEHGAKVVVNDLDGDAAQETADAIAGETAVYAGDLTAEGSPEALVQTALDAWGKIDIIVNNAGYTLDAPIHKMSDDWFQKMLDIHLVAPFRVIRAAAPHLREPAKAERERGEEVFRKIVNVSSISGTMGNAGQANYSAGKAGVVGLTKTLAKEWGQFKVNVNAVAFGWIETRLTASKDDTNVAEIRGEKVQLGIPEQMRGMAAALIPVGRPGTPEEAAGGVFFLCSPWANFVHGQVLNITGGQFTGMTHAERGCGGISLYLCLWALLFLSLASLTVRVALVFLTLPEASRAVTVIVAVSVLPAYFLRTALDSFSATGTFWPGSTVTVAVLSLIVTFFLGFFFLSTVAARACVLAARREASSGR